MNWLEKELQELCDEWMEKASYNPMGYSLMDLAEAAAALALERAADQVGTVVHTAGGKPLNNPKEHLRWCRGCHTRVRIGEKLRELATSVVRGA